MVDYSLLEHLGYGGRRQEDHEEVAVVALRRRRHGRGSAPGARAAEDVERRRRRVVGVGARGAERGPHARRDGRAGQPRRRPDACWSVEDVQVAQELLRVDAAARLRT